MKIFQYECSRPAHRQQRKKKPVKNHYRWQSNKRMEKKEQK